MTVNAFWLLLGALGVYAIFYRYYSGFLARRVLGLDDRRITPAHTRRDGQNFHPTNRWVLFGHHFAAITGAGRSSGRCSRRSSASPRVPLARLRRLPRRRRARLRHPRRLHAARRALARGDRARRAQPSSGLVAAIAILFIVVIALAGLGNVVVKRARRERLGDVHDRRVDPASRCCMGLYMYRIAAGPAWAEAIGDRRRRCSCRRARRWQDSSAGLRGRSRRTFTLSKTALTLAMAAYGFVASVLPVWMLLCPRDYLSSYMKIGTIALLVVAVILVHPEIADAGRHAGSRHGGGPIVPGAALPVRVHHDRVRRDHGLPRARVVRDDAEDARQGEPTRAPIGYGAMLMEGLVGRDGARRGVRRSFRRTTSGSTSRPQAFEALAAEGESRTAGRPVASSRRSSGEPRLAGRTGGGVSLARRDRADLRRPARRSRAS